jgi:site-specific recombinase
MLRRLSKKKQTPGEFTPKERGIVLSLQSGNRSVEYLVELVRQIRPGSPGNIEQAEKNFQALLFRLQEDRSLLFSLRRSLLTQFLRTNLTPALTESGLISSRGFIQELAAKLKHKILPAIKRKDDFLFVIERIFYKKNDYIWVEGMDAVLWERFFELIGIQINLSEPQLIGQLQKAMQIVSYRITTLGLEKEITHRFDDVHDATFPFIEQNRLVNLYLERGLHLTNTQEQKLILGNLTEALHNCRQSLQWIHDQRKVYGTSLAQTYVMTRMEQLIERMFIIVDVLDSNSSFNTERFIQYFHTVVRNENRKNSVREFLSENLGLLAYQISEHSGRRGEAYITSTRREYWNILKSAMGGGFIISFIAIFKNLLGKVTVVPFWQGLLFSSNYSLGFILIQESGSTLATKQPAFTASAVASSLDSEKHDGKPNLYNLALTVARVSRSQIASFIGNLIIVFPLTYALAWLFHWATGMKIAEGAYAQKLLDMQHPWQSLALVFACITGFFLFLSGIIAGYVENYVVYGKIAERIKLNAILHNNLSDKKMDGLVRYVNNSMGGLAGNIALGFFLGMAFLIGHLFGIPFDIRHITISAGNAAIGFYGLDHNVAFGYVFTIFYGVLLIGFLNFLISFGLAFYVAVKSRGIKLKEYPEFLGILFRYLRKYPSDFIRPHKNVRSIEEIEGI